MPLGIIDDTKLRPVPGTSTLEDLLGRGKSDDVGPKTKKAADGTILRPQPTDDPDDPLNWPLWQRDTITLLLCLLSVLASTLSPLLAANTITLINYFAPLTIGQAANLTGYHLLGVGVSGPIFVATARVWGKRHLFIIAPLIIVASSIWGGFAGHNYNSLVAARFFQGVGLAPFEGLVNAAVGEMYFVHESGSRLALSNMALFGGAFMTPVVVGKMTLSMGWQWTFWFIAIFMGALLPFVYVICPETTYWRGEEHPGSRGCAPTLVRGDEENVPPTDIKQAEIRDREASVPSIESKDGGSVEKSDTLSSASTDSPMGVIHVPVNRKLISSKNFPMFSGRKSPENFFKLFLRPFVLFLHPGILWACLTQGAMIAWTAVLGVSLAIVMIGWGFNEAQTGYMYAGAFIGAFVAFILAGLLSDPSTRWLTKRNNGIFEPEFRILMVLPMTAIGLTGLFGYGYSTAHHDLGWVLPDLFFGFVVAGMTMGCVASAQYIVDAHRDLTVEGFTCCLIFKNIVAFLIVDQGIEVLITSGSQGLFFLLGYIQCGICLTAVPMYVLGKKNRSFFARHDLLEIFRLR